MLYGIESSTHEFTLVSNGPKKFLVGTLLFFLKFVFYKTSTTYFWAKLTLNEGILLLKTPNETLWAKVYLFFLLSKSILFLSKNICLPIYYAFQTNTFFILWPSKQLAKFMCSGSPAQCEKLCRESGIVMYVLGTILHVLLDKNAHSYASFL